jgi:hypothetical protein
MKLMPRLALAAALLALASFWLHGQSRGEENPQPSANAPAASAPAATVLEIPDAEALFGGRGERGGGLGSDFGDPLARIGGTGILASYRVTWLPSEAVTGTAMHLAAVREELSISVPLFRDASDRIAFSAHVRNSLFDTDALTPKLGTPFPVSLWDIGFGLNWQHRFENNWTAGIGTQINSASDIPFDGLSEIRLGLNAFLRIPWNEHGIWAFSLSYSPFGELGFPIPGVAYIWQPTEFLRVSIGVPFSIRWRPIEDLTLDATYMPLTNVRGRVSYRVTPRISTFVGYTRSSEGYYLAERIDPNDRLLYRDSRVEGGVQMRFGGRAFAEVFGGYLFNRSVSEGQQIGGLGAPAFFIDAGPMLGGRVQIRW